MADGLSGAECAAYVDASVAKGTYLKLHTADPGAAGTTAAAGNTTRRQAAMAAANTTTGVAASNADTDWTNVSTAETYTHISRWTTVGPAGGTFLGKGPLTTPKTVAVGDNFKIPSGSYSITLTPAS